MIITLFRSCMRRTGNQDSAASDDSTFQTFVRHQLVLIIANRLGGIDGLDFWARSILVDVNWAVAVGVGMSGRLGTMRSMLQVGKPGTNSRVRLALMLR
jgi:hypothetical protein